MKNLLLALAFLTFISCKKELEQHCYNSCVTINGQVKNMETKEGIKDVPVLVLLEEPQIIFLHSPKKIAKANTDKFGNFKIIVPVDSSYFRNSYHVSVQIPANNKDLLYIPNNFSNDFSQFQIDSVGTYDLTFEVYPKATLNIKVVHLPNNNLVGKSISHYYGTQGRSDYSWSNMAITNDTTLNVVTGAGVFTKILLFTYQGNNNYQIHRDSIFCKSNTVNTIEVTF
jgi:hypothetical protein